MSDLIPHLSISQSHVFLLNSRLGLFTAASPSLEEAPLLPKLQGHFAEFLSRGSLEHLRILSSTTCVGLRYGRLRGERLGGFLGSLIRAAPLARGLGVLSHFSTRGGFAYPRYTYVLKRAIPSARGPFTSPSLRHSTQPVLEY